MNRTEQGGLKNIPNIVKIDGSSIFEEAESKNS